MRYISISTLLAVFCCSLPLFAKGPTFDRDLFYVPANAPSGTWALMEKAARLAAKSPHCVEVTGGAWSTKKEAAEDSGNHPGDQFYVTCQSDQAGPISGVPASFNLYYNYQDLKSGTIKYRPVPISDKVAIAECKQEIMDRLQYPSSARMLLMRYGANGTDNNLVVYDFTALNGFGNPVPKRGTCIIDPSNKIEVTITNR
ncbi:MAG: hypothetical protein WCC11_01170 [Gammaproteobacteria bacterium]